MTDIFDLPLQWTIQDAEPTSTTSQAPSTTSETLSTIGEAPLTGDETPSSALTTYYHTYIAAIFHNGDTIDWG